MPAPASHADALRITVSGVEVQHLRVAGTVPGVVPLLAAGRNGPGQGRLRTSAAGDALAWRAPGSATWGAWCSVPADGDYLLLDGDDLDCWLRVEVHTAYLVGSAEAIVALADRWTNAVAQADVTAAEAAAGDVLEYALTLTNAGTQTLDVVAWLDATTAALELSADGVSWSAPTDEASAVALGTLAPAATATLHLRRTIAAAADSDPDILNLIHLAALGGP